MTAAGPSVTRLSASLVLPDGRHELRVGGGEVVPLPDTPDAVVALAGTGARRRAHRITLDGRPLHRRRPAARVRAGLVVVGDAPVAADVTVADHLAVRADRATVAATLEQVPPLVGRGGDPAGVLSGGERRALAWARARLLDPKVVVLDRAATGLDTVSVRWATQQVHDWLAAGVGVLVRAGRAEEAAWRTLSPRDDEG
ncbi:hypothetical protein FTX61_05700 [Nitriliruptoraceae bacterium ZYF776]|nr:hypothetical protein [Profundirhabdus halotolerans]